MEFEIKPNANGRVYLPEVLKKAVEKVRPRMEARSFFGELEPPGDGKTRMSHVSHIVTDMRVTDDGQIVGDLEVLDTEAGKMLKQMLLGGAEMHATIKGTGTVDANGVVRDYKLLGVPFVTGPKPWESVVDKLGKLAETPQEDEDDDD
jgi:hypothetical protein